MAFTEVALRNHDFYDETLSDKIVEVTNGTARSLEQFELVYMDGWFGEVRNVEDVANGEVAQINIDSRRIIHTSQVADTQTFVVGNTIWFDPNGAAVGALYDSADAADFVPVGIITAIVTGHAYVEFRPFVQDTDLSFIRDAASRLSGAESDIDDLETAETAMKGVGWTTENLVDHETRIAAEEADTALNPVKVVELEIDADASAGIAFTLATLGLAAGDKIIDALVVATVTEGSGTLKVGHVAGNDITDAIDCAAANAVARAASLDQAEVTIGAANLVVTAAGGTAANIRGIMYITYIPA